MVLVNERKLEQEVMAKVMRAMEGSHWKRVGFFDPSGEQEGRRFHFVDAPVAKESYSATDELVEVVGLIHWWFAEQLQAITSYSDANLAYPMDEWR